MSELAYDVFVSYSRQDSSAVELLASRLVDQHGLRVWLDRDQLAAGSSWRSDIERAMNDAAAVLIVWGPQGLGPVQLQERDLAYVIRDSRAGSAGFRIIYALLPGTEPPRGTWANVDTWVRFEGGLDEEDPWSRLIAAVKGQAPPGVLAPDLPDEPAPYPGLEPFGIDDSRFFFGRGAYVREMLERLHYHPFLVVLGASGCGKTSLVQAGLLADLRAGAGPGSGAWRFIVMRPGPDPLQSLAVELVRLHPTTSPSAEREALREALKTRPADLPTEIRTRLSPKTRLALIVDRLEELFTLCEEEEPREAFLEALLALAGHPHRPALIIATMRADFYDRLSCHRGFAQEVVAHQLYLLQMDQEELIEAVSAPLVLVGASFEKGLMGQIVADARSGEEVPLPLLQHALARLWRERRGRWLVWESYEHMGGIAGALRSHADGVIEALSVPQRDIARRLLLRLIWLEESTAKLAGVRLSIAELLQPFESGSGVEQVFQALVDGRLIRIRGRSDRDPEEGEGTGPVAGPDEPTAELTHDTLPLSWDRLRAWVGEDREFVLWRQRLAGALQAGAALYGISLREAKSWLARRKLDLNESERLYIERSARRERWGRAAAFAVVTVLAGLGVWAGTEWHDAQVQASSRLMVESNRAVETGDVITGVEKALQAIDALPPFQGTPDSRAEASDAAGALVKAVFNIHDPEPLGEARVVGDVVYMASFAPLRTDGDQRLVTASRDGAWVWNVSSGVRLRPLKGHVGAVYWAEFNLDGQRVVTASDDGTARVWDAESGKELSALHGHEKWVNTASFAPGGERIVTASADGSAWIWDAASGQVLRALNGHRNDVFQAKFSADGKRVVTASSDREAWIWDALSGKKQLALVGHTGWVRSAEFSPDGQRVVTAGADGQMRIWDANSGELIRAFAGHDGAVRSAVLDPSGRLVVTASDDGTARVWDVGDLDHAWNDHTIRFWQNRGAELAVLPHVDESGDPVKVLSAAFSPDGQRIVTVAGKGDIRLWWVRNFGTFAELLTFARAQDDISDAALRAAR